MKNHSLRFLLTVFFLLCGLLQAHEVNHAGTTVHVNGVTDTQWKSLEGMLKDQLTLSGDAAATEPLADDLAFFTRQQFIRDGWPDAEVGWKLTGKVITLDVKPGQCIRVGNVKMTGNHVLPDDELKKYLLKPTLEREGVDPKLPQWVETDLQQGAGLVQRRLRAEGYLNAATTLLPAPQTGTDLRRDLTLDIKPGPKFIFGNTSLRGAPPELDAQMRQLLTEHSGAPFNEARVQQIEQRLRSLCVDHGWLHATAESKYDLGKTGGTVDVIFNLIPGERVRITHVTAHPGFTRGASRVLLAKFKPLRGRIYEADEVDFYFKRALDTGMFALLDTRVQSANGNPAFGELFITGEETKPVTVGFEVGYDTFLGAQAGVTYKNTNWRGSGNTLAAELSYSMAGPVGFVSHTNPALLGSSYALTSRLALEQFNRFEYTRIGTTIGFDLVRRVSGPLSYGFFFTSSANTVTAKSLTLQETGPRNYSLESIGANLILDHRDNPVLPKKGWFLSTRLEQATSLLGGNVNFTRTDIRGAWYQPLTRKFRFAACIDLANILGADEKDIPIDSRVFNGGPNSVRSFGQRRLGPVTPGGTPLGGTSALFASAEFSYEIITNLEFAVFTDAGSLGRGKNSSPWDFSTDFRYAVGAGIRYLLPFGPIRIDYGHNPDKRPREQSGMLQVTVGFAF